MHEASDTTGDRHCSESLMRSEERLSSEESCKRGQVSSDTLRRAPHIVILALLYTTIALFSWAVLCTLSRRPVGAQSYHPDLFSEAGFHDYIENGKKSFDQNDRMLRAARFSQQLASVLTIPLTSMVCSCAAVAFLQKRSKRFWPSLTLRQSMALADKGWTDPVIITKLIAGEWKRYGSIFLVLAIFLTVIGASISPLQGLFISYKSVKVPTTMSQISLIDLLKWVRFAADPIQSYDGGIPTTQLRSRLMSTGNTEPQFRLWSREAGCSNSSDKSSTSCAKYGQSTFANMPNTSDSFWAQPPVHFNTGLWKQFAPRINSSTKYEKTSTDDFPKDCEDKPGALYMHYENKTRFGGYNIDICMPANQSHSPWKDTRRRQDFSEELYVKMALEWDFEASGEIASSFVPGNYSFKITLDTTAGYFELPNYHNDEVPGPLIDDLDYYLERDCGIQCKYQTAPYTEEWSTVEKRADGVEQQLADAFDLVESVVTKGPLLSLTLALFFQGSYLDIHHTVTEGYRSWPRNVLGGDCVEVPPLIKLLHHGEDDKRVSLALDPCVSGTSTKGEGATKLVMEYIFLFTAEERTYHMGNIVSPSAKRIENAFTAAAFIAVDEWMQRSQKFYITTTGSLNWDMGVDLQAPQISPAGEVLISVLLGIYLIIILGLSVYSTWTPRWTNQLDSFAMMRIGSAAPGRFPLQLAHSPEDVMDLDELPGWIGGTPSGEKDKTDYVYKLGLGGQESLQMKRRYQCYTAEDSIEK